MSDAVIATERLVLQPMTVPFLERSLAGDLDGAAELLGATVPADWLAARPFVELRLRQLRRDPALEPWLLRAIIHRESNAMIGHIGCHDRPGASYLQPYAPTGIEIGYTIFFAHRRQGYAREALAALMAWASRDHGVDAVVLSISPNNEPSRRIAQHFGFTQKGTVEDEEDGPEDVFVLALGPSTCAEVNGNPISDL